MTVEMIEEFSYLLHEYGLSLRGISVFVGKYISKKITFLGCMTAHDPTWKATSKTTSASF
jgi:hypothetical protein